MTPQLPLSSVQQWRDFCAAVTADQPNLERCLSSTIELLVRGWGAQSCVVRVRPPSGPHHEQSAGLLDATLRSAMTEAERWLTSPRSTPVAHSGLGTTLHSLPLLARETPLGALHVASAEATITEEDVELVAQMLSSALGRASAARSRGRSRSRLLTAQHRLTQLLSASTTLDQLLPELLRVLCAELGWDRAQYWTLDQPTQRLSLHSSWPITAESPDSGWAEQIRGHSAPLWIADTRQDTATSTTRPSVGSVSGTVIGGASGVDGVLVLISRRRRSPDQALLQWLASFSSQLGQTIQLRRVKQELRRQSDTVIRTLNTMSGAVVMTDPQGRIEFVNPAFSAMTGYPANALLGRALLDFTLPDDRPTLEQTLDQRDGHQTHNSTLRLIHADGGTLETLTTGVPRISRKTYAGTVLLITDETARKRSEAEAARLNDALRIERDRLLRREIEVRTQIGRDLHDGPVQQVAVAVLTTQYVRRVAQEAPEQLGAALDDLQEQLQRTTQDLRTVLYELRPLGIAEEGLLSVLRQYVGRLRSTPALRIHLDAPDTLRRLAPDHEAAVFIIMQEALNNVRKHARARAVWLTLRDDGGALYAEVRDNGCGFDVAQMQASYIQRGSFGLLNMHERAQLIGGSCTISSTPGHGSLVQVRIPIAGPPGPGTDSLA